MVITTLQPGRTTLPPGVAPLCACGCGNPVSGRFGIWNTYLRGHHRCRRTKIYHCSVVGCGRRTFTDGAMCQLHDIRSRCAHPEVRHIDPQSFSEAERREIIRRTFHRYSRLA